MVYNFQEVITSLQNQIDQKIEKIEIGKATTIKRFILEQAASEMLLMSRSKNKKSCGEKPSVE